MGIGVDRDHAAQQALAAAYRRRTLRYRLLAHAPGKQARPRSGEYNRAFGLRFAPNFPTICRFFFRPAGRKKNLQKKKSTMLPFVLSVSKPRPELDEGGRPYPLLYKPCLRS